MLLTLTGLYLVFLDVALILILVDDGSPVAVCIIESPERAVRINIKVRNGTDVAGGQLIFADLDLLRIGAPV